MERIMEAGKPLVLEPGHTSTIRRDRWTPSYIVDMDTSVNPYELGLDRGVDVDMEAEFIGKSALRRIRDRGTRRRPGRARARHRTTGGPNDEHWPVMADGRRIGTSTSAVYSPRLERNIGLALWTSNTRRSAPAVPSSRPPATKPARVVEKPFYDVRKRLAAS
ncbi:MAG: glycine cleavage T C-terminal barrel domain-containing protein [Halofilum sp. (in: g-proteobacteria)]|nr:glycine cleavage T C-terminal barrel domain-containing protein [Halofilum sp. (in: g-proteobacteria)]